MNPNQYDEGPPIKVAAIRPGDTIWYDHLPRVVAQKCESPGNWFRLIFDRGREVDMDGNHVLPRADLRMVPDHKARTVNVVELAKENEAQRELIVDLRTEALVFESQVEGLQADAAELQKELRWRDVTIRDRDDQVIQLELKVGARDAELAECQEQHDQDIDRCKQLERQIRMHDKTVRFQADELKKAYDLLDAINTLAQRAGDVD